MDNDKALIKKCQNGNRQAFDMLIRDIMNMYTVFS